MSVVWEDPPPSKGPAERFGRVKSPLRKEADEMKETLTLNQGKWARLWDLETKEDARKRANMAGGKNFSFSVRQTDHGWSVFGRFNGEPEPAVFEGNHSTEAGAEGSESEVREPTFQ